MSNRILLFSSFAIIGVLFYFYGNEILSDLGNQKTKVSDAVGSIAAAPSENAGESQTVNALHAGLERQNVRHAPAKVEAPRRKSHHSLRKAPKSRIDKETPRNEEAVKAPLKAYMPQAANAPASSVHPHKHWIKEISGENVHMNFQVKEQPKQDCANRECPSARKDINVAGVVVESERLEASNEKPILDGRVGLGDASNTPMVHLK